MHSSRAPFQVVTQRARRLLSELESQLHTGKIQSQHGLLVTLIDGLQRLLGNLSTPTLEVPEGGRDQQLQRSMVETPVMQAAEDLLIAQEQVEILRGLTLQAFNLCEAERMGLNEQLAEITALADQFRLWVADSDPGFIWVGDTFNDTSKLDLENTSLFVDPRGGTVTLQPVGHQDLSERIVGARIDREYSQGGIPGNTLEIKAPGKQAYLGNRPEPRPELWYDTDPGDRITNLWDGEPDTWFEWETYLVPSKQKMIRVGKAWVYDPHGKLTERHTEWKNWNCYLRWPGDLEVDLGPGRKGYPMVHFVERGRRRQGERERGLKQLKLGFTITLDQPTPVSWLQITPFIRENCFPKVEQILISNDGQHWKKLLKEPTTLHPRMNRGLDFRRYGLDASNYEGVGVWTFPSTPVRYVSVLLSQEQSYPCPRGIGHRFFFLHHKKGDRWVDSRTEGPIPILGSHASVPGDPDDTGPTSGRGRKTRKIRTTTRRARQRSKRLNIYDIVQADRLAIGLRDVLLEQRVYAPEGQLVSKVWKLDRPVRSCALFVAEQIPEEWAEVQDEGGNWAEYSVSADGSNWQRLVPQRTELEDSVVQFSEPTKTVYFRALFHRPEDAMTQSPILQAYGLKLLPS